MATNLEHRMNWIFFDIDDTLWSFSRNSAISLRHLYDETELLRNIFPDYNVFDTLYHQRNSELWQLYHRGKIMSDYLKVERFRWPLAQAGYLQPDIENLCMQLNDRYLQMLPSQTETMPDALYVLEKLARKYLIGALSNGFSHVQYRKIYGSGLYKYINRMIVSDEIGIQKPDRRIFEHALLETGATADTATMVGDNPEADVQGAINAGWRAFYYDPTDKGGLCSGCLATVIHSLQDLLLYIP